jgi:hypothetical protein
VRWSGLVSSTLAGNASHTLREDRGRLGRAAPGLRPGLRQEDQPPSGRHRRGQQPAGSARGDGGTVVADAAQPRGARPEGNPLHVQASVSGLGDVLQLVKQATTAWNPKNPLDASAWVQAMLLQLGYGPGLWNSLDLAA